MNRELGRKELRFPKRRLIGVASIAATVAAYGLAIVLTTPPAPIQRQPAAGPIALVDAVDLFATGIYRTAVSAGKLPVNWVVHKVIDKKVRDFLRDVPVDESVKQRIYLRIESKAFVNEVVPFLFALKDQYMIPDTATAADGFDNYVRTKLTKFKSVPGTEHSLFTFTSPNVPAVPEKSEKSVNADANSKAEDEGGSSGLKIDKQLIAAALSIYDVIFLQTELSPFDGKAVNDPASINRAMPYVKALLEGVVANMDAKSDIAGGIKHIIENADALETATVTLVDAIRHIASKTYATFANAIARRRDLNAWMLAEFGKPSGGSLWNYLRYANEQRHYGVQIVVDGLQGHLMESLASGAGSNDAFIQSVMQLYRRGERLKPKDAEMIAMPGQKIEFFNHIAASEYRDPHFLPYFTNLYSKNKSSLVRYGISSSPTISVRNLPIAKTGAPVDGPGGTGVPNFHFVDRAKDRAYYFYGNDSLLLDRLAEVNDMKTMHQRLNSFNSLSCNATYDTGAKLSYDGFLNLAIGEKSRDFGDIRCYLELVKRAAIEKTLREKRHQLLKYETYFAKPRSPLNPEAIIYKRMVTRLIGDIAELEDQGLPQYLLYYNPWPDHFAHFKGPFSDEILSPTGELNRLDYWIGKIAGVYKNAGLGARTLHAMAGDHGLTPVFFALNPEVAIFDSLRREGTDFRVIKISSDEGEGPKMTNPNKPPSMKGYDVVVASTAGGNYMLDFFSDQGEGWRRQPILSELRALRTLGGKTVDVVSESLRRLGTTLDYLVVRIQACTLAQGKVLVIGPRTGRFVSAEITRRGDRIFYRSPDDLLDVTIPINLGGGLSEDDKSLHGTLVTKCVRAAKQADSATWCTRQEWMQLTAFTKRPDSVAQLAHIYDTDRAGTINLFPADGLGYNTKVPGRHAGEHFHEKDAFVGFWGEAIHAKSRILTAENGSLAPTMFEYLTGAKTETGKDGWGYPSLSNHLWHSDGQ